MTDDSKKIESVLSENRVKLHVFEPSNKKIWTVVGKEKEYWVYPEMDFCSCASYYFGKMEGKADCYHLQSVKLAQKENKAEIIKFSDDEFVDFVSGLARGF